MPSSLVSWSDHTDVVTAGLRKLYKSRHLGDFEIRCLGQRSFRVHKLVLTMFTDFFRDLDGLWAKLDVDPDLVEILLSFMYLGEAVIDYDKMEGFLQLCLRLKMQLFKDIVPKSLAPKATVNEFNPVTDTTENQEALDKGYSERYELSDFRLLCPRCYKCFETEKKSKAHKLACLTPATLKCPECDEMFRFAQTLKSHMMKHTDERPLICSWPGCDKTFKLKSSMTEHIRREHEKIEYKCPHCPKTYRYKLQVRDHVSSQHSEFRPFTCDRCGTSYSTASMLASHKLKVHGPNNTKVRRSGIDMSHNAAGKPKKARAKKKDQQQQPQQQQQQPKTDSALQGILKKERSVGPMGWFVIKNE